MFLGITNISATISCALSEYKTSYIWPTFCPGLHITTSEQTRHLGVIGIIDHKKTIAIFHALVNILEDFLRIRRITLHVSVWSMRLHFNVVGHCIATSIRCLRLLIQ